MKKLRQEFADTMLEVGPNDKDLVVMVGDISHGILQPFAKACPGRYFNIGICEPAMVNIASGMSKVGLNPVVHTIAPFITERSYEQIKLDFGYQKQNLNLVSVGGSFDYSKLGCSHHCYTDVSLISHLKRAKIVIPGSPIEFNKIFKEIYQSDSINYFRLPEVPHGYDFKDADIKFGKAIRVKEGKDITIAVTGTQLRNALSSYEKLMKSGVSVEIIYFHTLKPFDSKTLVESIKKTRKLVSLEELSAHDGLFNLCLKACIEIEGVKFKQMAVEDFIHGYGTYDELCTRAGLSSKDLEANIKNLLTV
jgi:transketolase